ncbi:hypothetical protein [Paraburkholderia sp. GAS199]|uniref:hypothetical protein n=1 Tax=Paraburkholderia sp. GAS199 TaxID=3035126 RepID=UPI003D1B68E7
MEDGEAAAVDVVAGDVVAGDVVAGDVVAGDVVQAANVSAPQAITARDCASVMNMNAPSNRSRNASHGSAY